MWGFGGSNVACRPSLVQRIPIAKSRQLEASHFHRHQKRPASPFFPSLPSPHNASSFIAFNHWLCAQLGSQSMFRHLVPGSTGRWHQRLLAPAAPTWFSGRKGRAITAQLGEVSSIHLDCRLLASLRVFKLSCLPANCRQRSRHSVGSCGSCVFWQLHAGLFHGRGGYRN